MAKRIARMATSLLLVALLGQAQQTLRKQFKNQEEYDLYRVAQVEPDPAKRLAALDQWKVKYPESADVQDRNLFYLAVYSSMQANATKPGAAPDVVAAGEKAARTVIEGLDGFFSAALKPSSLGDADWEKVRQESASRAHGTLATIALDRKDYAREEVELRKVLEISLNDAITSLLLSRAIIAQKRGDRYPEAIYQVARAVMITGPGELPMAQRKSIDESLKKMYEGYHGDLTGLDEVKEAAAKSPTPPAGWTIKSVTEISKEQISAEEQFAREHPEGRTVNMMRLTSA